MSNFRATQILKRHKRLIDNYNRDGFESALEGDDAAKPLSASEKVIEV
ncbi:hypothetical protein [Bacillus sp. AFS002410]|nr:hypothetical protein [Bacillus sp. AFS002410]